MSPEIMVAIHNGSRGIGVMMLAAEWGGRLHASVVGVGIIDASIWAPLVTPIGAGGFLRERRDVLLEKAQRHVDHALAELAGRCRRAGVHYREIEEIDTPHKRFLVEAQRHDVILLERETVPDPGLGVSARTILQNVLRHAPRPVVTVPNTFISGSGILFAYDGSLQASRALQALVASRLYTLGGDVKVLSVAARSKEAAEERAGRAIDYLAIHNIRAEALPVVSRESTPWIIIDEARRLKVEMIAMGSYGRPRISELFLGSTTSVVVDESPVPVFLFH